MVTLDTNPTHSPAVAPLSLRVAVADADPAARKLMCHWLEQAGFDVIEVASLAQARNLAHDFPDIVCVDSMMGIAEGVDILRELHAAGPQVPVVVVTAQRDAEAAVEAMRSGASDYVLKPIESGRLLQAVRRAKEGLDLQRNVRRLESELAERCLSGPMGGYSSAIVELDRSVARVVDRDVAVCLTGESGTGKDLVARAIHQGSTRRHGPFISVDCAAFESNEQETVLFGEENTDGIVSSGAFEQANGGVLFLEQVGYLSPRSQAALSKVLSTRTIHRVGGHNDPSVNVRLIAAHDRNLRDLVDEGLLREELFFRLVVYPVVVPSLKDRRDDIPLIISHFLRDITPGGESPGRQFSPEAMAAMMRYNWPGNLGELEHVVHRSALSSRDQIIALSDLPSDVRGVVSPGQVAPESPRPGRWADFMNFPDNEVVPLRDLERRAIEHALRVTGGSVSVAAQKLGIGRATLYRRIASLELSQKVA